MLWSLPLALFLSVELWRLSLQLQGAVSGVRVIVRGPSEPLEEDFPPPPPDISGLQIGKAIGSTTQYYNAPAMA